ncbi:hypothetical protein GEMRC1_000065 [Eukaryota sp. GEM-RC1]
MKIALRRKLRELYNGPLAPKTRTGNLKASSVEVLGEFLSDAFNEIGSEFIANSFQKVLLGELRNLYIAQSETLGQKFLEVWNPGDELDQENLEQYLNLLDLDEENLSSADEQNDTGSEEEESVNEEESIF